MQRDLSLPPMAGSMVRGAHASRVSAWASRPSHPNRSRRDAESSTRDACAPRTCAPSDAAIRQAEAGFEGFAPARVKNPVSYHRTSQRGLCIVRWSPMSPSGFRARGRTSPLGTTGSTFHERVFKPTIPTFVMLSCARHPVRFRSELRPCVTGFFTSFRMTILVRRRSLAIVSS
jgi:hypothetical protein